MVGLINLTKKGQRDKRTLPFINKITKKTKLFERLRAWRPYFIDFSAIILGIILYQYWGIKGIFISVIIDAAVIIIIKWSAFRYAINWGFKYIYGKYPYEFKKGDKLPRIKWIGFKKRSQNKEDIQNGNNR